MRFAHLTPQKLSVAGPPADRCAPNQIRRAGKVSLPREVTSEEGVFMKRFWTAWAVALAAVFAAAACNDYGNTFQVPTGARISSLSPSNMPAGSPQFTLTVNGGGFVAKTVVQWNGTSIPTQVQTDASGNVVGITATVSAALVAKPGTVFVNTLSPFSGAGMNGLSNPLPFIITPPGNPVPTVTSMSPTCAVAGGSAFTLTVTGSNFLPASDPSGGSQVHWNAGGTQNTLPIVGTTTATQIQATVSSALVASPVTAAVTVFNPPSPQSGGGSGGGGTSPTRSDGAPGDDDSRSPSISANGRYVAFSSAATNLLAEAPPGRQVYLRDTCAGAAGSSCAPSTQLISTDSNGALVGTESILPSVSASGRFVAFVAVTPSHAKSSAHAKGNGAPADSGFRQVFVRDTCVGAANCAAKTTRISLQPGDASATGARPAGPALSGQAKHVALPGASASTLFTRGVVVDDQVFLALTGQQ